MTCIDCNQEFIKGQSKERCDHCYIINYRRKRMERSEKIPCACGCGEMIYSINSIGRPQKYKLGHWFRDIVGENHWKWKGGTYTDKQRGYITIIRRHHPYRNGSNKVYLHRYLKELDLGYYITKEYEVDHINGDKRDNRPENLQVLLKRVHRRKHTVIDMTNRKCILCGIKYEERVAPNKRQWYEYETGYICAACNIKIYKKIK